MSKPSFTEKFRHQLAARNMSFKSITAMILFGIIILVFVLFTGYGKNVVGGAGYAARVNNTYISLKDLDAETARLERSFGQMLGQFGGAQRSFVTNQALQSLVQTELISQYSEKASIYATDHEIKEMIVNELPYFQQDGGFRREVYENILAANHMTPSEFEEKLRKDRKLQHVRMIFENSASPLKAEIEKKKLLAETQMDFQFVRLEKEKIAQSMPISDATIAAQLANADFKKKVEARFAANPGKFDVQEEVHAAHILIKTKADDAASDAAAKKKIAEIQAKLKSEDFGKLAGQYSEDAGSKANKGDLGFFGRGKMVPEFEDAAFGAKPGTISEPIKTQFGYHLIKVLDKKAAKKAELAQFERSIAKELIAEEKFESEIKHLEEKLTAKDLNAVNEVLKGWGVSWQNTGLVDLGSEFIPALNSKEATQAAFELNEANPLSRLVRDADSKFVIQYKTKAMKPSDQKITNETFQRERSVDRLTQWLEALQKSAKIERNPAIGSGATVGGPQDLDL